MKDRVLIFAMTTTVRDVRSNRLLKEGGGGGGLYGSGLRAGSFGGCWCFLP